MFSGASGSHATSAPTMCLASFVRSTTAASRRWRVTYAVRSYIRSAYSWGIKSEHDYRNASPRRFKLVNNPAAGIPTEPKVVGTRWLDDDEYVTLYRWLECPDTPVPP